jgi:hypothetical protein
LLAMRTDWDLSRLGAPMAAANPPKETRRRRNKPVRGDWKPTSTSGWQHGEIPPCPDGLMPPSVVAWDTWMQAWFAVHWTPEDLPGLRQLIRTYDQVERNEFQRGPELRLLMDTYGITPKGQQDRRWQPPKAEEPVIETPGADPSSPYGHLRAV